MLSKRCRLGVASLHGKLYAAGGYDGNVFLKSVECYDPVSNKWTYIAPMNVKRSRVALVANCRKLYAIGGYDGEEGDYGYEEGYLFGGPITQMKLDPVDEGAWPFFSEFTFKGMTITAVPAPGTVALAGLGGLAAVRRRR